jgi:predicted helicase
MYAQTLTYGLFAARYYDQTPETFSRSEARDLLPGSNPLLQRFFDHIAGVDFEKTLTILVDELCAIFRASDVKKLVHDLYKTTNLFGELEEGVDPIVHFYEDFLREYDPKEKAQRGVFYTPLPVVQFIVKSVDEILEQRFGCVGGLADSERKDGEPRVQILDPAVGTGTFLSEVIRTVHQSFKGQEGRWVPYVKTELVNRLFGFELMMAPYTIAHLKLSLLLADLGATTDSRLNIFLTNSLEPAPQTDGTLFSLMGLDKGLADEAFRAGEVKNSRHIMAVIGNPPYAGKTSNKEYNEHSVYKFEPGTNTKLKERNPKWINDDYVKFIRFAEEMVEKTGEGVVGMITPHGWLDNPTFRGMRHHLLSTFDEIQVVDLHGNANKKEKSPDGSADNNVFDIKQGVSIVLAIRTNKKEAGVLAKIKRFDLQGTRSSKFDFLKKNTALSLDWVDITPVAPNYELVLKNQDLEEDYERGFSITDLFDISGVGIVTARDSFVISEDPSVLIANVERFRNSEQETQEMLCRDVGISNKKGWDALLARKDLKKETDLQQFIKKINYRPFDTRFIFYHPALVWRTVDKVMTHMSSGLNIALVATRQAKGAEAFTNIFAANLITESTYLSGKTSEITSVFPLWLYDKDGRSKLNFKSGVAEKILEKIVGAEPEDIFYYIYAQLYSQEYREKFSQQLKRNYPRVPYPVDSQKFRKLVSLGKELTDLHKLESPVTRKYITSYNTPGTDIIEKISRKGSSVYINDDQYFGELPDIAWNFYLGGYQPAQKWLKDRKTRKLTSSDIEHYQKIIVVLVETDRIMKEIDSAI